VLKIEALEWGAYIYYKKKAKRLKISSSIRTLLTDMFMQLKYIIAA